MAQLFIAQCICRSFLHQRLEKSASGLRIFLHAFGCLESYS
ncbi:MAG: hypothetical protein QRY72_03510 [Candidatus Rhabdochlamydia sp.]